MGRKVLQILALGLVMSSAILFAPGPANSLCGDCGFSGGAWHCISNPPTYSFCRSWVENHWIEVPGECGTCPSRFIRVEVSKCEGYVTCAV